MQLARVRPPIEVKVGRFVLKPPELAAVLARRWISRWVSSIGFPASIQALGSWGTKKPYLSHEHPSAVALAERQSSISHRLGVAELDAVGYTLDSMGRRTAITRPGAKNDSYVYDAAGQVTAGSYLATTSGTQNDGFAYDAMGNRTTSARNGVNTSYVSNNLEQYSNVGGTAASYDANGNALTLRVPGGATSTMTWDAENRMLQSTRTTSASGATVLPLASNLVGSARIINQYDVLHRRVVKEVYSRNSSGTWILRQRRRFTYDGWNLIGERVFNASGTLTEQQRYTCGRDLFT